MRAGLRRGVHLTEAQLKYFDLFIYLNGRSQRREARVPSQCGTGICILKRKWRSFKYLLWCEYRLVLFTFHGETLAAVMFSLFYTCVRRLLATQSCHIFTIIFKYSTVHIFLPSTLIRTIWKKRLKYLHLLCPNTIQNNNFYKILCVLGGVG